MRGFVIAGLTIALVLGFADDADARGGRGFGFARTSPAAQAKPASKPRSVLFVSTGGMGSRAAASPAGFGAAAGPAALRPREAPPAVTAVAAQPGVEAEAPRRPWCDTGKVLGGLCVLN